MSDPDVPAPQPGEPAAAPPASVPPASEPMSIWRTLDGQPIPRRATNAAAARGTGFTQPANLVKPPPPVAFPTYDQQRPNLPTYGQQPAAPPAGPAPTPLGGLPPEVPRFVLATFWSRVAAFLIDGIVLGLATLAVTMPIAVGLGLTVEEALIFLGFGPLPNSVAQPDPFYALLVVQVLGPPIAAAIMLTRWNGQTLGKQAMRIRVVCADGSPVNGVIAVRREVLARTLLLLVLTIASFGLAYVLNYLWPLWDSQSRTGHDAVAGTRVVQVPRDEQPPAPQ